MFHHLKSVNTVENSHWEHISVSLQQNREEINTEAIPDTTPAAGNINACKLLRTTTLGENTGMHTLETTR